MCNVKMYNFILPLLYNLCAVSVRCITLYSHFSISFLDYFKRVSDLKFNS